MNSTVEITLEKPGIIAVSEALRKQFGLGYRDVPNCEDARVMAFEVRVKEMPSHLTYENHVLVYNGELTDQETDFVQQDREQRLAALMS